MGDMRVRFTLFPVKQRTILPINYTYFLTGLIYSIIGASSMDYSRFLHDRGYRLDATSAKGFKLFTYSMLMGRTRVLGDRIAFEQTPVEWLISSPVNEFVQHLVNGTFEKGQEVAIGREGEQARFLIEQIETLPPPVFSRSMRFTCLSPITASKVEGLSADPDDTGTLTCHYIRPWEEGFSQAIRDNLIRKYRLITGEEIAPSDFAIRLDEAYVSRRNGRVTKNINFKGTNIIGFMAPFEASGDPRLIQAGYEAGFGEKGSMGFGMVREVSARSHREEE
jgi:CRISPR-associated endoribonuclease Cas6